MIKRIRRWFVCLLGLSAAMFFSSSVKANPIAEDESDERGKSVSAFDSEFIDASKDMVLTAAKRPVAERLTPLIVQIRTREELRQQGIDTLWEALGRFRGYQSAQVYGEAEPTAHVAGSFNATLILWDGIVSRDHVHLYTVMNRSIPMELVKRVEVTAGAGGVLWGSGALLGVASLTPLTADDFDGVEVGVSGGSGPGSPGRFRAYVMGGQRLWRDRLKVLVHASYDTWYPQIRIGRTTVVHVMAPGALNGQVWFSPDGFESNTPRNHVLQLNGNAHFGRFMVGWRVPVVSKTYLSHYTLTTFSAATVGQDALDCSATGIHCVAGRGSETTEGDLYDRTVYGGYVANFANRGALTAKGWYTQPVRDFRIATVYPNEFMEYDFGMNLRGYMVGVSADLRIDLGRWTVMAGGDSAYSESTTGGYLPNFPGRTVHFCHPTLDQPDNPCPVRFFNPGDRLTAGVYANLVARLGDFVLEGRGRVERGWLIRGHETAPSFSGSLLYPLGRTILRLNYGEGVRAPPSTLLGVNNADNMFYNVPAGMGLEKSRVWAGQVAIRFVDESWLIRDLQAVVGGKLGYLHNLIRQGIVVDWGDRQVAVGELGISLALRGGHRFGLSYTYQDVRDRDLGVVPSTAKHIFSGDAYFRLIGERFAVSTNIIYVGESIDINRYPSTELGLLNLGRVEKKGGELVPMADMVHISQGGDVVADRLPPSILWNIGFESWWWNSRFRIRFDAYNVINAVYYYPDVFFGGNGVPIPVPNQAPRFSFLGSISYHHGS